MGPFSVEEHTVCVAFSPDGRRVLTGGWEGSLPLREAESGRKIRRLLGGHERAVTCVE
jgi:WD40 repeat protein